MIPIIQKKSCHPCPGSLYHPSSSASLVSPQTILPFLSWITLSPQHICIPHPSLMLPITPDHPVILVLDHPVTPAHLHPSPQPDASYHPRPSCHPCPGSPLSSQHICIPLTSLMLPFIPEHPVILVLYHTVTLAHQHLSHPSLIFPIIPDHPLILVLYHPVILAHLHLSPQPDSSYHPSPDHPLILVLYHPVILVHLHLSPQPDSSYHPRPFCHPRP